MTDTPERIWADQDNLTWVEADPEEAMKREEVEYVRAPAWRTDMDAAPKDGTRIELFCAINGHRAICRWTGERWSMGEADNDDDEIAGLWLEFGSPTHWMPLSAAPRKEDAR